MKAVAHEILSLHYAGLYLYLYTMYGCVRAHAYWVQTLTESASSAEERYDNNNHRHNDRHGGLVAKASAS